MTQEASNPKETLSLKVPEPEVSSSEPWGDDVLGRAEIAGRLTNLIRDQSVPFSVSVHGQWGTGKTFMLQRWQKALENDGFKAIYFNAWEDDFCDDPLLAIIGQLSGYLKLEEGVFKSIGSKVRKVVAQTFLQTATGLAKTYTGIPIDLVLNDDIEWNPLEDYRSQRATKDELKKDLEELSDKIRDETGHPLVFIIDELDRCRPTFAIELLERVKHIFDVPDIVFVFGINRDELCKSLASIYGEIDVDVYLRRFFDMEFTLPEADAESFAKHLMDRFGLREFFGEFSREADSPLHQNEFQALSDYFPLVWSRLGLSLRDIDYCVRLISLVGKNIETRHSLYPWVLGLLIPLKHCNPDLYRQFVQSKVLASQVMDYVYETIPLRRSDYELEEALTMAERFLYCDDRQNQRRETQQQLELLIGGEQPTRPELISKKTLGSDGDRISGIAMRYLPQLAISIPSNFMDYLAKMIDLHQEMVRR